jgi:hypothetical protein
MYAHALTIKTVRDGPVCTLIPRTAQQDLVPVEPGAPFPAGTEGCP